VNRLTLKKDKNEKGKDEGKEEENIA